MKNSFSERCYSLLRKVPKGKVTTYKALAMALNTYAYRAVGNAMHRNPHAPTVPCHRVVSSSGKLGGFALGVKNKTKLLEKEGISVRNRRIVDFDSVLFVF
jgi:methylated-DNA-[protein]-cysteine S-methyltransferase